MIRVFRETIKQYSLKSTRFVVLYIVLAAFAAVSSIIGIQATGNMTQAANMGVTDDMISFLLVLAIAGIVQTLLSGAMALAEKRAYGSVIHTIRRAFVSRLLKMPYKDFSVKNSGEGATLFTVDVPQTASFLTIQVLAQIAQLTTLVVSVVFMLLINWWLTLGYFALFPLLAMLQAKIAMPIGKKREEAAKRRAEYNAVVSDALQNPLTVLAYGLEASVERRYTESFAKYYSAQYSASKYVAGLALLGVLATSLPIFALFLVSCAVVISDGMTIAEFIALTIIAEPAASWLTMFSQELARLQTAKASVVRVSGFAPPVGDEGPVASGQMSVDSIQEKGIRDGAETSADDDDSGIKDQGSDSPIDDNGLEADGQGPATIAEDKAVGFNDVTFGYDHTKVFDKTNFSIEKGHITAIVGPSGCGKSTALKLILGLYAPDSGEITTSSANITYVPQDCYLLPVSIRDNILSGLPLDDEKLRRACEKAGILDFIHELPDGFDSVLVESAANVSGGQKQRFAMARAFYRDADILLLDEATSALDPETEQAVLESFKRYIIDNDKTAVVVAHRQSVIDISDRIITLTPDTA